MLAKLAWPLILVGVVTSLGVAASQFNLFSPACSEPIEYSIGQFDERFGISRAAFADALSDAAAVWNDEAGKTLIVAVPEGGIPVHLEYSTEQQTSELGEEIDAEQAAYNDAKEKFESLARSLEAARTRYDALSAAFDKKAAAYDEQVAYWNARGGAPPAEYAELERTRRSLQNDQAALNAQAEKVNAIVADMNGRVDNLNALADAINRRVDVYNASAHTDFDQGRYISDEDGERITIREFTEGTELRRVLAHELGHALGFDHVENPDSIMYSYNVGSKLALTEEDTAEMRRVCEFE